VEVLIELVPHERDGRDDAEDVPLERQPGAGKMRGTRQARKMRHRRPPHP
jgi:hypothetical protein